MTKLTDTQSILLSTAAQREDASLWPLADTVTAPKGAIAKSIASLIQRGFAEERETNDAASFHRSDGDLRYGVFATAAGLAAIGVGEQTGDAPAGEAPAAPERQTKSAAVIALLRRDEGATLVELIAVSGWLPHTTRAAIIGLRKKGHVIERTKCGTETYYHIAAVA